MLLNAFILISVMLLILNGLYESTMLQIKMTAHFKQHRETVMDAEARLQQRIKEVEKGECIAPFCELIQFVPDAYFQYETQGVYYYQLTETPMATVAVRKPDPVTASVSPISLQDLIGYETRQIPVIGDDPENKGVIFYVTITSEDAKLTVIEAWQRHPNAAPKWLYTIDENTRLSVPTLWHGRLIVDVPDQNKIAVYDAYTGEKLTEGATSLTVAQDIPQCSLMPIVLVRQSREDKRRVMVNRDFSVWVAELEIDYERLGKRADILVTSSYIR